MNDELKPCPFCGSNNIGHEHITTYSTDSSYDVFGCNDCGARFEDGTPEEWNRRATGLRTGNATADLLDAEVKKLREQRDQSERDHGEAVDRIEALTAERDALRAERYRLAYAICGGEDAPGLLDATPVEALERLARDEVKAHSQLIDRTLELQAERDALRAEAARIADDYHPEKGQEVLALSEMREAVSTLANGFTPRDETAV